MRPRYTYLLPFRRAVFAGAEAEDLTRYFKMLAPSACEILLVDGSPAEVFEQNARALGALCRHEPVDRHFGYLNDKVNGIHTGVELASCEQIILADDDIRYGPDEVGQVLRLLETHEVVRPQNFLSPLPWWAKMEAARMLINRATLRAADYPGTCAFRRAAFLACGQYDGDVLFDNEEILRHFALQGRTIAYANDLFVRKRSPTLRKWIEQRPRQAYEDFGMRGKTALFLSLPPLLVLVSVWLGLGGLLGAAAVVALGGIALTWRGRARGRAAEFFPLITCLFAPLWVAERSISTYWAFYWFFTRGGHPFGDRLLRKGVGRAWRSGARIASVQLRQARK